MPSSTSRQDARAFGARARLGVIVPTTNTVNEAEWACMAPPGVTFHTARMALHTLSGDEPAGELPAALRDALAQLTPAGLSAIAYACTAGSMVSPVHALPRAMGELAQLPCTSTAAAIIAALQHLGVASVAVATPYHDALNNHEQHFLQDCGFSVSTIQGLGIGAGGPQEYTRIARLPLAAIAAHATATFTQAPAEALLISCTDFPTLPLIPQLEQTLGVPVVSSNTATLWHSLALAGIAPDIADAGVLMRGSAGA